MKVRVPIATLTITPVSVFQLMQSSRRLRVKHENGFVLRKAVTDNILQTAAILNQPTSQFSLYSSSRAHNISASKYQISKKSHNYKQQ